jgi:hypothetical protein
MFRNYAEFMTETASVGMAMLMQGQTAMMQRAQEASAVVVDAAEARGRRTRHAA